MKRLTAIVLALVAFALAACSNAPTLENVDEVCPVFTEVRNERAADSDDTTRFEVLTTQLREVLPEEYHDEMALYYYPYGGSVEGLDTSGTAAERAGELLDDLYRANC